MEFIHVDEVKPGNYDMVRTFFVFIFQHLGFDLSVLDLYLPKDDRSLSRIEEHSPWLISFISDPFTLPPQFLKLKIIS